MASRNPHLPTNILPIKFYKTQILSDLVKLDNDQASRQRILALETGFRLRIGNHVTALPLANAKFAKFFTSPFVLMIYAHAKHYTKLSEIENDILPAKLFSSMETSAGRMIEDVALPIYGWQAVSSGMHTVNSALDGKKIENSILKAVTLKSGPRCLNDGMSENFADTVIGHGPAWLLNDAATELEFTYGVLYGTKKQSNKKDWHILRNIVKKLPSTNVISAPEKKWDCKFMLGTALATATIRIGKDWWDYLGGPLCLMEICTSIIRACVSPGLADPPGTTYVISDLANIVDWPSGHASLNVSILQASQLPWLFFLMRHFCDVLED